MGLDPSLETVTADIDIGGTVIGIPFGHVLEVCAPLAQHPSGAEFQGVYVTPNGECALYLHRKPTKLETSDPANG